MIILGNGFQDFVLKHEINKKEISMTKKKQICQEYDKQMFKTILKEHLKEYRLDIANLEMS